MTPMPKMPRRSLLASAGALTLRPARAALSAVALVIGNGGYQWEAPLANPRRDARAVGLLLESLGLRSETVIDGDRAAILAALAGFAQRAAGADLALLFFAGHGVQRQNSNWLVPVDADLQAGANASHQLVAVAEAVRAMARAKQRVLVLDACRNDPLAGASADTLGLARIDDTTAGSLFCFATSPGRVALDGTGQNSPFTDALLDHLGTPGLELRQVLTRVRRKVLIATDGQQVPWDNSSLTDDVVLRGPGLPPVPRPVVPLPAPPTPTSAPTSAPLAPPPAAPAVVTAPTPSPRAARGQPAPVPSPSEPRGAPAVQHVPQAGGEVAYDPMRYREIPQTYARAESQGMILPTGLLVQRRDARGRETPLTGSYVRDDLELMILLGYDATQRTATFIAASSSVGAWNRRSFWFQRDGVFEDGVLTWITNGTTRKRWNLVTGWTTDMNRWTRTGLPADPATFRMSKLE